MKKKMLVIGIISMFLLISLSAIPVTGINTKVIKTISDYNIHVDDDWAGSKPGDTVFDPYGRSHIFGKNAFGCFQNSSPFNRIFEGFVVF